MDELETRIRKYYVYAGIGKGIFFSAVGIAFVSQSVSMGVMVMAAVLMSAFLVIIELISIYPRDMKWHRTLVQDFGDQYNRRLSEAVDELGYFGIFRRNWIAKTFDELHEESKSAGETSD